VAAIIAGARHGSSIADSRPIASNDPGSRLFGPVLLVNFRAGNYSGCPKNKQYRENGERTLTDAVIREKRKLASRCTTNRFAL
jgi:hypothetical protein